LIKELIGLGFHNPYNFVRTPDRGKVLNKPFAGDYDPSQHDRHENHSRYWEERYTGVIPVRLRTRTPLFITDSETKTPTEVAGHYVYGCMSEIPATAIKGMLSSAYETITNSRYRVFSKGQHDKYLGYRHPATATLAPARIVKQGDQFCAEVYSDAAWLPAYDCPSIRRFNNGDFCNNVTLRQYDYANGKNTFKFWSVENINGKAFGVLTEHAKPVEPAKTKTVSGYVVKSGKIFNKKHDERFFFDPIGVFPIPDDVHKRYERLIEDYQDKHKIVGGRPINPPIGAGTIHGAHITDTSRLKMTDGLFVYVLKSGNAIKAVYPVQISRDLSDATPWDCLDEHLRPATEMSQLSPADRLFGYVPQKGKGAWRGKVRVVCEPYDKDRNEGKEAVETFEPFPLSILGAPKPEQARFYCGDNEGKPQNNGITKQNATYKPNKRLRGRKVYLHHSLSHLKKEQRQGYWDVAGGVPDNQEYSRFSVDKNGVKPERSNQNRSIKSWIPPRRDFSFNLRFENLTSEELGALLALLGMEQCCFRLGFGKPLGFGSVALSVQWDNDTIPVVKGSEMKSRYGTLEVASPSPLTRAEARRIIQSYQRAMAEAYGDAQGPDAGAQDGIPWMEHGFVELLNKEEAEAFRQAWQNALDAGQKGAPLDALPERETVLEFYPDIDKELSAMYAQALDAAQARARDDFGWSRLSFIDDFQKSMTGFADPVCYPRISPNDNQEGFAWFVENEQMADGHLVNAYSLPKIGEPLEW